MVFKGGDTASLLELERIMENQLYTVFVDTSFEGYCWASSAEDAITQLCGPESERGNSIYEAYTGCVDMDEEG